jgi:hypothetical protein
VGWGSELRRREEERMVKRMVKMYERRLRCTRRGRTRTIWISDVLFAILLGY